jgi:hypothetical protein
MSRIIVILAVMIASIGNPSLCIGNGSEALKNGKTLNDYLSEAMSITYDSLQKSPISSEDSLDRIMGLGLMANDQCFVTLNDTTYFLLLMSCVWNAELLFIDSLNPAVVYSRISMNKPGMHARFVRDGWPRDVHLVDINKD